jgi:hypothetical protein
MIGSWSVVDRKRPKVQRKERDSLHSSGKISGAEVCTGWHDLLRLTHGQLAPFHSIRRAWHWSSLDLRRQRSFPLPFTIELSRSPTRIQTPTLTFLFFPKTPPTSHDGSFPRWCRSLAVRPVTPNGCTVSSCRATATTTTDVDRPSSHPASSTSPPPRSGIPGARSVWSDGQHRSVSPALSRGDGLSANV